MKEEIENLGCRAYIVKCDLADPIATSQLIADIVTNIGKPIYALINSAAIFEPLAFIDTSLDQWERHMAINLRAPYILVYTNTCKNTKGSFIYLYICVYRSVLNRETKDKKVECMLKRLFIYNLLCLFSLDSSVCKTSANTRTCSSD